MATGTLGVFTCLLSRAVTAREDLQEIHMTQAGDGLSKFRLDGAVALMTGGASGIGRACAELFVQAGARVVLLDRDEQAAQTAAHEIGPGARARALDVTNAAAVDEVFSEAASREGRIDVLVNNAGIVIHRPTLELELENWRRAADVNMTGVFLCGRHKRAGHPAEGRRDPPASRIERGS